MSSNPVALITGASRGIGRGIALELAAGGYDIAVNYVRNEDAARSTVQAVEALGSKAIALQADVGDPQARHSLLEGTRRTFKRLDLLVNNAAMTSPGRRDLLEATEDAFDTIIAANLKGPFFLAQAAARWMVAILREHPDRRLSIINISSLSEYAPSVNRGDYCIAKAGLRMLTLLFAVRLAEHGIRVNEVRPGIVATDMTAPVRQKYDRLIADGLTPIRRWGQPEDVGRAVRALAGPDFEFATGLAVDVDGGFHIRSL